MRACLSSLLLGLFALQRSLCGTSTAGLGLNAHSHNRTRLRAGQVLNTHTHNLTRLSVGPVLNTHAHNRTRLSVGSVLNAHSQNRTKLPEGGKDPHHRPKRGWVWNQFYVLEEHIGPEAQYVGKLHSNSDKGDGSVRYLLSGEGAGTIFTINESTGDIHATKSLDREKKNHYVLHARAIHSVTHHTVEPESEFIIKVQDVNDNAPTFPNGPFTASVPEMADIGTSVLQITATDADDPTYGNSARIVYSVLQGQAYFSIDPKTGVIRTAQANMDRETREMYSIIIQAKDMAGSVGGLSGSTTINITLTDINDNPPRFPQKNYQLYVPESAQVGKAVGKIKANDEDLGINAEMEYKITNEDGAAMFSISADSEKREGVISLRKHLDYETKKAYTLSIEGANTHMDPRFSHLGPFKDTTTLKIIVGDVDEAPIFPMDYYIMDIYENMPAGTDVGVVTAQDPDNTRGKIRYSIDESADGETLFSINENSGLIKTTASLDREAVAWHNITVSAAEVDNPKLVSSVPVTVQVLDVNDNTPYIQSDSDIIVCESTKAGQVIQTIRATDRDNFANGRFSFALSANVPANPNFTLKDNEDSSASIVARRWGFSRADQELHHLDVVVWDGGEPALSSTTTLTLRVCPCQRGLRSPTCRPQAFFSSAGLSTGALIAILLCVLILLAIVVLFVTLRSKKSKKETLIISEEDIRENVVTYDDEGGGEEDTEAFDMAALRNPEAAAEPHKKRKRRKEEAQCEQLSAVGVETLSPSLLLPVQDIQEVLHLKVVEADQDMSGPPYDSLQTYAYEGQGSPSGSISSLDLPEPPYEPDTMDLGASWPDVHSLATLFQERSGLHTL
ncbi:cadherin-18-like [Tachysurus vachellii]|uniref:cadherin-18-like n=1 Tax=Tachysurus vachellii TaxID=175792 RepID=UPI00296B470C|nr:cadherin-18-like [Tachysurus vachellii]XP_060729479.1 cadherin-18-like [Tachysurus vachellii]XP_060729482.1 cadherin-18-like [Tachysurus vachellii]